MVIFILTIDIINTGFHYCRNIKKRIKTLQSVILNNYLGFNRSTPKMLISFWYIFLVDIHGIF